MRVHSCPQWYPAWFPALHEEWCQKKAQLSKTILGRVRPEWDEFSGAQEEPADTVPRVTESSRLVTEAGTDVQLSDLSKMWGLDCRSTAETLVFMQGHKGPEHLVGRLEMPCLKLLHKCPKYETGVV